MCELKMTNNPCKYCNGEIDEGKPLCGDLVDGGDVTNIVKTRNGYEIEYWRNFECQDSVKINFCPFCGRNLKEEKKMRLFKVKAGVRYYEDGKVNGEDDISYEEMKAGKKPKIPCVQQINGEWVWCIDIDADTGIILNWPKGNKADVHYKVCDCCEIDVIVDGNKIFDNEEACSGYVPDCLCPSGEGWGDYMIMHIDENGQIADWNIRKVNQYIERMGLK